MGKNDTLEKIERAEKMDIDELCGFVKKWDEDLLCKGARSEYTNVREAVAEFGNGKHRDMLINDAHWLVREAVAEFGDDKHRDVLINDKNEYVKRAVATFGNKGI